MIYLYLVLAIVLSWLVVGYLTCRKVGHLLEVMETTHGECFYLAAYSIAKKYDNDVSSELPQYDLFKKHFVSAIKFATIISGPIGSAKTLLLVKEIQEKIST